MDPNPQLCSIPDRLIVRLSRTRKNLNGAARSILRQSDLRSVSSDSCLSFFGDAGVHVPRDSDLCRTRFRSLQHSPIALSLRRLFWLGSNHMVSRAIWTNSTTRIRLCQQFPRNTISPKQPSRYHYDCIGCSCCGDQHVRSRHSLLGSPPPIRNSVTVPSNSPQSWIFTRREDPHLDIVLGGLLAPPYTWSNRYDSRQSEIKANEENGRAAVSDLVHGSVRPPCLDS